MFTEDEVIELRAEIDRLRGELAEMTELMQRYYIDWDNADEALARVRELCDQWRDLPIEPPYMTSYQSIQEFIRHALDGSE